LFTNLFASRALVHILYFTSFYFTDLASTSPPEATPLYSSSPDVVVKRPKNKIDRGRTRRDDLIVRDAISPPEEIVVVDADEAEPETAPIAGFQRMESVTNGKCSIQVFLVISFTFVL
jgi:hypothetical protein